MEIEEILEFIQNEISQGKRKTNDVIRCVYEFMLSASVRIIKKSKL